MDWTVVAMLIAKEGLPIAERIYQKWASGNPPTQADFDELKEMAKQMARDRALKKLADAGIDPNSDQGKLILSLVG